MICSIKLGYLNLDSGELIAVDEQTAASLQYPGDLESSNALSMCRENVIDHQAYERRNRSLRRLKAKTSLVHDSKY